MLFCTILKRDTAGYLKRRWSKSQRICSFGRTILKRKDGTGICRCIWQSASANSDRGCVADVAETLKVLGYNTCISENDGEPFLLPRVNGRSRPRPPPETGKGTVKR